jgi:hypothetical protein
LGESNKTEERLTWNDGDCYDISCGVGKSRRYHAYMREWYRRCHDLSLASAAVAGYWSKMADQHDELNRRFSELAAKMHEWPATEENRQRACAERIRIEADEPTERRLIDLRAQNDEMRASGVSISDLIPLSWWQMNAPWAYIFTFGMYALQKRIDAQEKARRYIQPRTESRQPKKAIA